MAVAMILAAGRGERMRPLTDTLPKPLLQVHGKALIEHHLERLALAGYQHVVINHAWLGNRLVGALSDGKRYGINIHYSAETQALETAGGIVKALPILNLLNKHSSSFLVVNSDVFCNIDFSALPQHLDEQLAHLVLVPNPAHNELGDFSLDGSKIVRKQKNDFTFSGVAVYHKDLFNSLNTDKRPLAPLLFAQAELGKVTGEVHSGYWFDIGTPQRLTSVNNMENL